MKNYLFAIIIMSVMLCSFSYSKGILEDAKTLPMSSYKSELSYEYLRYGSTYWDTEGKSISQPAGYNSATQTVLFDNTYGLIENVEIGFELPFIIRNDTDSSNDTANAPAGGQRNIGTMGIGDIIVKQKICFLKEGEYYPDIAAGLKLKLPSGDANPQDTRSLPIGTGTLDFSVNTYISKTLGNVNVILNCGYLVNGDAPTGKNVGDAITGGVKIGYKPIEWLLLGCELTGYYKFIDQDERKTVIDNSDAYLITASPIVIISPIKEISIEASSKFAFLGRNENPYIAPRIGFALKDW